MLLLIRTQCVDKSTFPLKATEGLDPSLSRVAQDHSNSAGEEVDSPSLGVQVHIYLSDSDCAPHPSAQFTSCPSEQLVLVAYESKL